MSCQDYEPLILAYALGELGPNEAAECVGHIQSCPACRETYETYAGLAAMISGESESRPTPAESEALTRALAEVCNAPSRAGTQTEPMPGLPAMIVASVIAFVVIATTLALQTLGYISLVGIARAVGPAPIAAVVIFAIFVTSFLPIAAAAKHKPLNGMTFRRG
jgi:anti-sigma factor RsiW